MADVGAPDGLDLHLALVVVTPALIAAATAIACAVLGRSRGARVLAALGLLPALVLQGALLAPHGIAWRCLGDHVGGWVWIHPLTITVGLLSVGWVTWRWDPWRSEGLPAAWAARVSLALALPVVMVPMLLLSVESDLPASWRPGRIGLFVLATVIAGWWPVAMTVAALALVAVTGRGGWRPVAACLAVALAVSPFISTSG